MVGNLGKGTKNGAGRAIKEMRIGKYFIDFMMFPLLAGEYAILHTQTYMPSCAQIRAHPTGRLRAFCRRFACKGRFLSVRSYY
ncbi:hypothetical protein IID62_09575 [candidate division KSB1 bacterium]|nr:hypothetical protein [candidate division KSB1 bacterium]